MIRLRALMRIWIALVWIVLAARVAGAVTFAVEIRGEPRWEAEAIAAALVADLADTELRAAQPAEVIVRGELTATELVFVITGVRGAIAIPRAGLDRAQLAGRLRDELHRVVRPSGDVAPGEPVVLGAPELGAGAIAGLAGLLVLVIVPLVLGRARWQLALVACGVLGAGLAIERLAELGSALFVIGGIAWGVVAAITLPIAAPPIAHLHRAEHGELMPVLRAWSALAAQRVLWLAGLLVPAGLAFAAYAEAIALPEAIAFGVVAPLAALVISVAWRASVEILARRLDRELVAGDPAWHAHVRAYYTGYLRRANLDVDEQLLDRVSFLPGKGAEVAVYARRIVIPRAILEHALAPYGRPHDYPQARVSTLHWTHWNSGLVMPTEAGDKLASLEERQHVTLAIEDGEFERIAVGEVPTLIGIVEPVSLDPRTSYRPGDDPLWLDWDPGEEFDGTDAGDKDYLFGIVVASLGIIERGEDRRATVVRVLARYVPGVIARTLARLRATALADQHAALGGARHHLAQWIAWRALRREDLLTARAYVPELEQKSRAIAVACTGALGERIARLRVVEQRPRRRRLALAIAAAAVVAGVLGLVVQAVRYHATYEDRMTAQRKATSDGKRP